MTALRWVIFAIALLATLQSFRGVYTSRTKMDRLRQIVIPFAVAVIGWGIFSSERW